MRELISKDDNRTTIRWKLLTSVSAVALAATISSSDAASDRPMIWLQASGQFDQLADSQSLWVPEFVPGRPLGPLADQYTSVQKKPRTGFDADASVLFQPQDSDWSLRASVGIGKARQPGSVLASQHMPSHGKYSTHYGATSHNNESHEVVDFQAGKDVGLGGGSTIRAGVRIASLRSRSDVNVSTNVPISTSTAFNDASSRISRRFAGVGPSLAWDGSVPIAGAAQDGQLVVDWSAAASFLFGRQTTKENAKATYQGQYRVWTQFHYNNHQTAVRQQIHNTVSRSNNVTVPNLGGFAAVSWRTSDAKVSLGYRADFFFGAIDGGIGAAKKENRGFFGPFASVSIGIGN
jgi:hypothetical protein